MKSLKIKQHCIRWVLKPNKRNITIKWALMEDEKAVAINHESATTEVIISLAEYFKNKLEEKKGKEEFERHHYGVSVKNCGTLIFIEEDYEFTIRPKPRIKRKS